MADGFYALLNGNGLSKRYFDVISEEQKAKPQKTGDEIVVDIMARGGLSFKR